MIAQRSWVITGPTFTTHVNAHNAVDARKAFRSMYPLFRGPITIRPLRTEKGGDDE